MHLSYSYKHKLADRQLKPLPQYHDNQSRLPHFHIQHLSHSVALSRIHYLTSHSIDRCVYVRAYVHTFCTFHGIRSIQSQWAQSWLDERNITIATTYSYLISHSRSTRSAAVQCAQLACFLLPFFFSRGGRLWLGREIDRNTTFSRLSTRMFWQWSTANDGNLELHKCSKRTHKYLINCVFCFMIQLNMEWWGGYHKCRCWHPMTQTLLMYSCRYLIYEIRVLSICNCRFYTYGVNMGRYELRIGVFRWLQFNLLLYLFLLTVAA